MNDYIKPVIYTILVVAYAAWNVSCFGVAPQGMSVSYSRPTLSASSSFLQHESGAASSGLVIPNIQSKSVNNQTTTNTNHNISFTNPPRSPIPQGSNTRDYVNPTKPVNTQQPTNIIQNTPTTSPTRSPFPQGSNTRNYVNPNRPAGQTAGGAGTPVVSGQSAKPFVNTQFPFSHHPSTTSRPNQPGRDYVNPQFIRQNYPIPTQNSLGSTSTSSPTVTTSNPINSNRRDYVARRPKPDFPVLPKSRVTQAPVAQNSGSTVISYAQRVSDGLTTKSPLVAVNPPNVSSPTGSPETTNSTTEKPLEGPTDAELREFSEALLRRDVNNAGKYVTINYQGKTTSQSANDEAPEKLLQLKSEVFQIPTIAKLIPLHNNYILETNENEHVTPQEKAEENELLDAMLSTPIMQYTRNYLISMNKLSRDPKDFKDLLKQLWFSMYSRSGGRIGSSGFEHIFLAELKKNDVSGLHNWLYFDQAENNKIADYLGYMKKIDLGEKGAILKYHFKLKGVDKPVNSMFIGTSPELEIALYTTCYVFRADRICPLRLAGHNFVVRTYNIRYRGKNTIGSAFPEI